MDLGGDDNDEEEEEEERTAEGKVEPEEREPVPVHTPDAKEPEGKRRKDRIVKIEEKKTIKLQRKTAIVEMEHEHVKMEVEEGTVKYLQNNNNYCCHYIIIIMIIII